MLSLYGLYVCACFVRAGITVCVGMCARPCLCMYVYVQSVFLQANVSLNLLVSVCVCVCVFHRVRQTSHDVNSPDILASSLSSILEYSHQQLGFATRISANYHVGLRCHGT